MFNVEIVLYVEYLIAKGISKISGQLRRLGVKRPHPVRSVCSLISQRFIVVIFTTDTRVIRSHILLIAVNSFRTNI